MSVYRRNGLWHYDFWLLRQRYTSPTGFDTKDDAREAEDGQRRKVKRRAAGLETADAKDTPTFTDWAGITFKWQRDRKGIKRPEAALTTLRMVLAFWGAKPAKDPVAGGEYRNLRLGDPIARPELLEDFEEWMTAREISGARKNHYRSACSMLYRVALLPANRKRSGVTLNPFAGIPRDRVVRRTATLTPEQIEQWTRTAPLPVAIAVTVAALAPALRFGNIVDLRRDQLSPARDFLAVSHKADRETGAPLTISISEPLRRVIAAVEEQWPDDPYVVPIVGDRYWQLQRLVKASITAAGMTYGRTRENGVTFHSLRHALSTWLARWGVSLAERQRALGHQTPQMAAWYTHLGGHDTVAPMALIGERLPIAERMVSRIDAPREALSMDLRKRPRGPNRKPRTRVGLK